VGYRDKNRERKTRNIQGRMLSPSNGCFDASCSAAKEKSRDLVIDYGSFGTFKNS